MHFSFTFSRLKKLKRSAEIKKFKCKPLIIRENKLATCTRMQPRFFPQKPITVGGKNPVAF